MVYSNECKQLRKHPEPLNDAKREVWCFQKSEININYYKKLKAFFSTLIYRNKVVK